MLADGEFGVAAREFIAGSGSKIDVGALFKRYAACVDDFYAWLRERIDGALPPEIADYRRCADANRRTAARTIYQMFLQIWIDRKVDPYKHLDKYLSPEALDEIAQLPQRSSAQVSRIIELADRERICDDEIRALVFRLFAGQP